MQLETPIVIPRHVGQKYAMTVYAPTNADCQANSIFAATRNPQDLVWDADHGRNWDPYDPAVDILESGFCDGSGSGCDHFVAEGTPRNYLLLFGYSVI